MTIVRDRTPEERAGPEAVGIAVLRRRCVTELRNQNRPIGWIAAAPGTGKTHLLRQIGAAFAGPVVSIGIEEHDTDPGRFFHRLARAAAEAKLGDSLPSFGSDDVGYLRNFALRSFARIDDCATSGVLFSLDDMHHLEPAPELLEALAFAVGGVTQRSSFVIASREAPPSSWARFSADGRMARLSPNALLMDAGEIRDLLSAQREWRHGADETIVSGLLGVTQGWAAGLGVLLEFGRTQPKGDRPFLWGAARDMVFESFGDHIVAAFSPAERHQLMLVAQFPVLYVGLVREVLGNDACRLLERLYVNNTLVAKDYTDSIAAEPCYRLHSLFREFLRSRGELEVTKEELRDLRTRMARRLLARGEDDAARELLLEAENWTELGRHLEEAAGDLFAGGRSSSLTRFVNALPAALLQEAAPLSYWRGVCLLHLQPSESRRALTSAYARFKALGDRAGTIRAWGALVDAIWFEWEDCARLDPCIEDLPFLAAESEVANDPELTMILARGAVAALSIRRPEHPDFDRWEARNLALFQRRLPKSETIRRGLQLMIHYVYGSGERRKAEIVRSRIEHLFKSEMEAAADHCVYYVVNAAYQFWFSADPNQAPSTVLTGLAVTERLGLRFWDVPMLNAALFRLASDGNVEALRNMLAMLDERLSGESREHDLAISHHFAAYLAWLEGDHEKASIAIAAACRIALESGFCISPVYYGIGQAAILESAGRRKEALRQLGAVRRAAVRQKSRTMMFMADMVGAASAMRAKRKTFALRYLRRAFAVGEHQGFCAAPWVRPADRRLLCDLALEHEIAPRFARALGATARAPAPTSHRPFLCTLGRADIHRDGRSELTSRKLQVMPLLLMLHLVAAARQGRSSDQLIDAIWPDADTETGRRRLKTTLYRLRRLIGEADAISSTGGLIRLDSSLVDADAWEVERLSAAEGDQVENAERALHAYQGPFVDLYSGHAALLIYREQVALKVERLVASAGEVLVAAKAWDRASVLYERCLDCLGFHEEFMRRLEACLHAAGRTEALRRLRARWVSESSEQGQAA